MKIVRIHYKWKNPKLNLKRKSIIKIKIIALGIVGSIDFTSNRKMEIIDKKTGKLTGKITLNAKGTLYRKFDPKNTFTGKLKTFDEAAQISTPIPSPSIKGIFTLLGTDKP